ncbi:phage integrase central domain-containing protein [Sphingorhabdus sp. M41]|uniref:phage integrase central domain-containing protein n=1 Tax=Sphingorhabdus sp. M41 TaxID=1806885 RepID=UPI003FA6A43B
MLGAGRNPPHSFIRSQLVGDPTGSKSFDARAHEWCDLRQPRWKPIHTKDVIASLERDIFPLLRPVPLIEIDEPLLLSLC